MSEPVDRAERDRTVRPAARAYDALARLPELWWFAYGAVLLVQARGLWGIWRRDLEAGDTGSYFEFANLWTEDLAVNAAWSPAYSAFLGTINWIWEPVAAEHIHRVLIVVVATVLVLALLRRLLPPWAALLGASWWAALPIIYATKYSIHLFSVLPLLGAALLLTNDPGPKRKGGALALLLASTVLVRNEAIVIALVLAAALIVDEVLRQRREGIQLRRLALAIGVPIVLAVGLAAVALDRSNAGAENATAGARVANDAGAALSSKESLVVCQAYKENLQQRGIERHRLPCAQLLAEEFDDPSPSFATAWINNPGAMIDFTAWNLRLLPAGMQVALFNAATGEVNPGYEPVALGRWKPAIAAVLVLLVLLLGAVALRRDWGRWSESLRSQRWAWIGLGAIAIGALVVILMTQRPRAAYMFGLTAASLALIGLAAAVLVRRLGVEKPASAVAAIIPFALVLVLPTQFFGATPVRDAFERTDAALERPEFDAARPVIAARGWTSSVCSYQRPNAPCQPVNLGQNSEVRQDLGVESLTGLLDARGANILYVDEFGPQVDPELEAFVADPPTGWSLFEQGTSRRGTWYTYVRDPGLAARKAARAAQRAAAEQAAESGEGQS